MAAALKFERECGNAIQYSATTSNGYMMQHAKEADLPAEL